MASEVGIVLFFDLAGSVKKAEQRGHAKEMEVRESWFSACESICEIYGGTRIKNLGDGFLIKFESPMKSLLFSVTVLQYFRHYNQIYGFDLNFRITLFSGLIDIDKIRKDIFGQAVYLSARMQKAISSPPFIIVEKSFERFINIDDPSYTPFFKDIGSHTFKGIKEKQKLFIFNWEAFLKNNPTQGLASLIKTHFENLDITFDIDDDAIVNPSTIIWPVATRNLATAIHKAQIEVIKILTLLGWKVHIVVADCGPKDHPGQPDPNQFIESIEKCAGSRSVNIDVISFMSKLFDPLHQDYSELQGLFHSITSKHSLHDISNFKTKEGHYKKATLNKLLKEPAISALRPVMTMAIVLYLSNKFDGKCIVIAGHDENLQWDRLKRIDKSLGFILIPRLKELEDQLILHAPDFPSWMNKESLIDDMDKGNMAEWICTLHAMLPAFPARTITINKIKIAHDKIASLNTIISKKIGYDNLANHVWPNLNK